jgi:hypothetical protein
MRKKLNKSSRVVRYVQKNPNAKAKEVSQATGVPIAKFCVLRSKMYSIFLDNEDEKKTGKGI